MTTFAQALARIEDIIAKDLDRELELEELLVTHAGSIVQLAKVAAQLNIAANHQVAAVLSGVWSGKNTEELADAVETYDKLMKGEKG